MTKKLVVTMRPKLGRGTDSETDADSDCDDLNTYDF